VNVLIVINSVNSLLKCSNRESPDIKCRSALFKYTSLCIETRVASQ